MKIWRIILVMIVVVLSFHSCSDNDPYGKWDPMVWKAEVPVLTTDGIYTASADGAEFTFSCQNYSLPWVENAVSNGKYYYPPREANNYHTISADWFKVEISGNTLKVVFEANETTSEKRLELTVTAGDIFYTFKFKQFANCH